jgi:hypothetical protein
VHSPLCFVGNSNFHTSIVLLDAAKHSMLETQEVVSFVRDRSVMLLLKCKM